MEVTFFASVETFGVNTDIIGNLNKMQKTLYLLSKTSVNRRRSYCWTVWMGINFSSNLVH